MKLDNNVANSTATNESGLKELCSLWLSEKEGTKWFTGNGTTEDGIKFRCVGFIQKKKKKTQPDIKVYLSDDKYKCCEIDGKYVDLFSLWKNESKSGTTYYSGLTKDKERIVAFKGKGGKAPSLYVYLSAPSKPKEDKPDEEFTEVEF